MTPPLRGLLGNAIVEGYMQVDQALGEILQNAGDDTHLLIVSDHGIAPVSKWFYINNFLKSIGLLHAKDIAPFQVKLKSYPLQKILNKMKGRFLSEKLPHRLKNLHIPLLRKQKLAISEMIEWNATRAYATSFGININLRGRELQGIVPPEEYHALIEEIRAHLYRLEDPDTGRKIISKVYTKEELYSGRYVASAPDIQFLLSEPQYMFNKRLDHPYLFKNMDRDYAINAHHINSEESTHNAIFMAYGKHLRPVPLHNHPRIMDIVPTALYLMGLPIPEDLDGRVITEIFDEQFLKTHPINYQKIDIYKEREALLLSKEDEEKMREHLRNLGYIE